MMNARFPKSRGFAFMNVREEIVRSTFTLLVITLSLLASQAQAQRILLVGDSWVAQAWTSGAFSTALANKGLPPSDVIGGSTTIGGTTAAQWATQPYLDLITAALQANPTVEIIHLSIGGNDFLGAPPGSDPLVVGAQILSDTQIIVDHIKNLDPTLKVAHASYDYIPAGFTNESAGITQLLINQAELTPGYFIINDLGLLHHVFGYPPNFAAGATPLPGGYPSYIPLMGGDPAFGGNPAIFADAIHPGTAGYVALAEHAIDEFYMAWLTSVPVPGLGGFGIALLSVTLGVLGARKARA